MTKHLHNDEEIMRYLDGEMSNAEIAAFEEALQHDEELNKKVESLRTAINGVKLYGTKEQVARVHQQMLASGKIKKENISNAKVVSFRRTLRYVSGIAAVFFIVFLAIEGYNFYKLSPESLYNENYVHYNISTVRGGGTEETLIETAYKNGNYKNVIQTAGEKENLTEKESFLTGLSYMQVNEEEKAVKFLLEVMNSNGTMKQDAEYYLALAYLKDREYDKALQLMQSINANKQHIYNKQFSARTIWEVKMLKWK